MELLKARGGHVISVGSDAASHELADETIEVPATIADGAQTQSVGRLTFALLQRCVDAIDTVTDDELVDAMRFFAERMKLIVEPTGWET